MKSWFWEKTYLVEESGLSNDVNTNSKDHFYMKTSNPSSNLDSKYWNIWNLKINLESIFWDILTLHPFNQIGPIVDQNKGVSETQLVRMQTTTCSVRKSSPTWLVCMRTTKSNVLFTLESPQVTISTAFFCCSAILLLIRPKIIQKWIQNGGNRAERQN